MKRVSGLNSPASILRWLSLGFLLLALGIFFALNPFALTGPQQLYNPHFYDNGAGWDRSSPEQISFLGRTLILRGSPDAPSPALSQVVEIPGAERPEEGLMLLLRADAQAIRIEPGPLHWQQARLLLVTKSKDNPGQGRTHELFRLSGSEPWQLQRPDSDSG